MDRDNERLRSKAEPRNRRVRHSSVSPRRVFIRDMYYDSDKYLYVASNGGLIIIDTENQTYSLFDEDNHFSEKNILTVYKDSRNLLWIGHSHGISVWDQKNDSILFLTRRVGLPPTSSKLL